MEALKQQAEHFLHFPVMRRSLFISCCFLPLPFRLFQTRFEERKSGHALNPLHASLEVFTLSWEGQTLLHPRCVWGQEEKGLMQGQPGWLWREQDVRPDL